MAERKKAVKALIFKSGGKNGVEDIKTDRKLAKIVPRELTFFESVSPVQKDAIDTRKKFTKMPANTNHRPFNLKQENGQIKPSRMLIYEDCEDEDNHSRTTPPSGQDRYTTTPRAPIKSRKEFDKKVLRPKKLVYNDKDKEEDLSGSNYLSSYSTPKKFDKKHEGYENLMDTGITTPRKIAPIREDRRAVYSTIRQDVAGTSSRNVQTDRIYNYRNQGSRKKNFSSRGANIPKNDLTDDKENNAGRLGAENDAEDRERSESYKNHCLKIDRNAGYTGGSREEFGNVSKLGELTHFRI